jgi:predicted nuclease of restriction endonuclease-like RecB superfamily
MLTSDLLVTKNSKGKMEPIYALLDQDNLEIASSDKSKMERTGPGKNRNC